MLSSDHDGEVIGAARAIGRTLQDAGADWHALADAISFPKVSYAKHLPPDDWRHMARACRMRAHRLSPREFDFINNVAMEQWEPTEKQVSWLRPFMTMQGEADDR